MQNVAFAKLTYIPYLQSPFNKIFRYADHELVYTYCNRKYVHYTCKITTSNFLRSCEFDLCEVGMRIRSSNT